ncbi:MAG: CPBP family intramembrane metalloprotease [Anaerolineaceae bacterium]|nr:CPBP family intramembrane metalloprotease [Anaerolineaceae bacterium]
MNNFLAWLKKQSAQRPVGVFFGLTYLLAWLLWLIAGLVGDADRTFFRHLCTFAAFAPAFAAVLTLLLRAGQAGEAQPRLRWDVLLGGWLVTGILYFVALPYASATPVEASIPGWIARGLMWLGPAWVAAWATDGSAEMRRLLLPPPGASTAPGWYALALLGLPALILAGDLLGQAAGLSELGVEIRGVWWQVALTVALTFVYLLLFGGALSEEPALRGFALPMLQKRFSPLVATLILGALTTLWYLPMHLNGFYPSTSQSLPVDLLSRLVGILLMAILCAWAYNRTRGNVLVCVLMHASFTTAATFLPQTGLTLGLLTATTLFAVVDGKMWEPRD